MDKYYLIICKNDFPPVNQYTILCYNNYDDIPYKYRKLWHNSLYCTLDKMYKKDEELIYFCHKKDPVEAMIDFWSAYMYNVPGERKE